MNWITEICSEREIGNGFYRMSKEISFLGILSGIYNLEEYTSYIEDIMFEKFNCKEQENKKRWMNYLLTVKPSRKRFITKTFNEIRDVLSEKVSFIYDTTPRKGGQLFCSRCKRPGIIEEVTPLLTISCGCTYKKSFAIVNTFYGFQILKSDYRKKKSYLVPLHSIKKKLLWNYYNDFLEEEKRKSLDFNNSVLERKNNNET